LAPVYRYAPLVSTYGGVKQRWLVIYSQAAYSREIKTLLKNYQRQSIQEYRKGFACQADGKSPQGDDGQDADLETGTGGLTAKKQYTQKSLPTKKSQVVYN